MGEGTTASPAPLDGAIGWFFEHSQDIFITLDGPLIASANPSFVKLTGFSLDEALGRSVFAFLPEDQREAIEAAVYDRIRATGLYEGDHAVLTKDGRLLYIRSQVRAGARGTYHAIWQDITADHVRQRSREQSRRSAEMLREAAGIRVWRYDPATNTFLMGLSDLEQDGDSGELQSARLVQGRIVKEDSLAMKEAWESSILTGEARTVEYRLYDDEGWLSRVRTTWRGARKAACGRWEMLGVTQDVTELAEARDAALYGERAAHQAAEAKAQFLANMSHEIRTPMNGVLGVLHLLKNERLSSEGEKLLQEALACGGMLAELLNDVMDFSKIEAGKLELNAEPIDLAAALEGVTGLLRPQAEAKGLYLRAQITTDASWAQIDPVRLRQMLFNLIGNAVKFTGDGGIEVRMTTQGKGAARRLKVEIQDTGIGISQEAQGRLFERFTQADGSTTRKYGGTGLGLAITRKLAELMGGEVGLISAPGEGSTFWFEISAPEAAAQAQIDETDTLWLEGLRVLVVEDNATNRLIATKMLENLGASVATANDGALGVEAAKVGGYDLIFMDVQMPVMDGIEAARMLRSMDGPVGQTPIVAMTANAMAHQKAEYLAAGMNGVVSKPLSPAALLAELARLSAQHEDEQAA